jgi:ABC-type Na+ efflux pump permease subunit
MNKILVVAKKEMKELINNKRTFITGVFFAL